MRSLSIVTISILALVIGELGTARAAADVRFQVRPPSRATVGDEILAEWTSRDPQAQFRYKLDVPGDWMFGIRYKLNQWSDWGQMASLNMSDFVLEGNYTLTVEARNARGEIKSISAPFRLSFVAPQIRDAGIQIDWARARAARSTREQYQILSDEYWQAYKTWMKVYDGERRALRSSWSGEEMVRTMSGSIVGKGDDMLLAAADRGVSHTVSKVLLPKMVYDIAKQSGINAVLIFRNARTNAAASKAISSYWAYRGYESLAQRAR